MRKRKSDSEVIGVMAHIMDSNHKSHDGLKGHVALHQWHVAENGWDHIGYHFFIDSEGYIHHCRPHEYWGSHCPPRGANRSHIGVCFFGKSGEVTQRQWDSFKLLVSELKEAKYHEIKEVVQHSDFDPVRREYCAGIKQDWIDEINIGL